MFKRLLTCGLLMMMMTSCMTVGPDYQRPDIDAPDVWRFEDTEAQDLANTAWWRQFDDPVLNDLVRTALKENKDVRIATARIEEFFGRYFAVRGGLFPFVEGRGDAFRERVSEEGITQISDSDHTYSQYEAFLGGRWEIDFWGKLRRSTEAARADLLATEEARRTVILNLVSGVAAAYVDIQALEKQLEITRRTAESRRETLELFQLRFSKGIVSEVDLSQAESEYAAALARIPDFESAISRTENALSILLGRNPGPVPRGGGLDGLLLVAVPQGVPSDLLERRPDIRQAEQGLISANARIGVAKSQYFPTISLTGAYGTVSTDFSDWFSSASRTWNYGVPVSIPLFSAGRIGGEVKAAEAARELAVQRYLQTILIAFGEVEDALVDRQKISQRIVAQERQLKALQNYARLARLRYDEGYTGYLEVLDAERSLFDVELAFTASRNALFRALIDVYKTMGGGWIEKAETEISPQPVMESGFVP